MPGNSYSFFKTESPDGVDYLFLTENKRIYTVSFDMSIYASYAEMFPTLLQQGYGVLFGYDKSFTRQLKTNYCDIRVGATIADIIADFLETNEDLFVVLQCDYHKQKLFNKWFENFSAKEQYSTQGIEVELKVENRSEYFGFICKASNPKLNNAIEEIALFSFIIAENGESDIIENL